MEVPELQRRRWLSWLPKSIWPAPQPGAVDARDDTTQQRGQFFPFLGSNAASRRTPSRPAAGSNSRNSSIRGGGDSAGSERREASARRVTEADEKRLRREIPPIWEYLREQEGWSFVNNRNWDVLGPAAAAAAAGGGGGGSGGAAQQQAGPMPLGQLPAYLAGNPALHGRYRRWLSSLSPRPEGSEEEPGDDGGGGIESVFGAGASASAVAEGENDGGDGVCGDRIDSSGGDGGGGGGGGSGDVTIPAGGDGIDSGGGSDGATIPAGAGAGVADAADVPATVTAVSAPSTTGVPLPHSSARGAVDDSSGERDHGQAREAEQQQQPDTSTAATSSARGTGAPAALSPPCPGLPSCRASSDGGGSSGSGVSVEGSATDSCPASTPPLAFRTRSRGRRRAPAASHQSDGSSDREVGRGGVAAAAAESGGGGRRGGRGNESVGGKRRAAAAAVAAVIEVNSPPRALSPNGASSRHRGPPPTSLPPAAAAAASSSPPSSAAATTPLQGCASATRGRQGASRNDAVVGWETAGRISTARSSKGKGRRKTLLVMGGGGGVAGRLVGSGRRAGAAAKRRHSEVGDGREAGLRGTYAEDGGDPPPSGKRPRVKLERESGPASPRRGSSLGPPMTATVRRPAGYQPGGGTGCGGSGSAGDIEDDPLAPYARIAEETVSDEGLEGLLHTARRDGFLDLRRYRKPGWPRPLRITRLEASHGKRFEEHLLLLLQQKRRIEANVFLRRLAHYDRNPPHLAASLLGGGAAHKAVIPAWYQQVSADPAVAVSSSAAAAGGGMDGDHEDTIEEVVDLTLREVEVVECYDNEPLDCVMMQIVKQEPGLEEEGDEGGGGGGCAGGGQTMSAGGSSAPDRLGAFAGTAGAARPGSSTATPRVKMEVG